MEHVSSVHPTGKFPEKVENLKRWARFPGWNFRTQCRVPFTFLVVSTGSRSTVGHRDVPRTYRGLRPNGTTFYQSEFHFCSHRNFRVFILNGERPYSLICIILSDLLSRRKTQKNSYFQTRSERLIIIHIEEIEYLKSKAGLIGQQNVTKLFAQYFDLTKLVFIRGLSK